MWRKGARLLYLFIMANENRLTHAKDKPRSRGLTFTSMITLWFVCFRLLALSCIIG